MVLPAAAGRPSRRSSAGGRSCTSTLASMKMRLAYVGRNTLLGRGIHDDRALSPSGGMARRDPAEGSQIARRPRRPRIPERDRLQLGDPGPSCLRRLPGPILTRDDVEKLFLEHNADPGALECHVFCALYRVGLLGYLHHDWVRGEWVQRFLRPGEGPLEPDGVLPRASHYFVHPVLSDVVGRLNPVYLQHVDRINIVGYGRPWRSGPTGDTAFTAQMLCADR